MVAARIANNIPNPVTQQQNNVAPTPSTGQAHSTIRPRNCQNVNPSQQQQPQQQQTQQNNRATPRTYHPAVSPYRYPEYAEPRDCDNSQLVIEAQLGQLPTMNACQGQQYIARVLGHRRYEGRVTDCTKTIALGELIGHARSYQRSTGTPEALLVSQLATFFSGAAFKWWQSNGTSITSLGELETRLKSRFEGKENDGMSALSEFCTRIQQKGESLLDFVDDMRNLAAACYPPLTTPQITSRIIDNSSERYRNILAVRHYDTVAALDLFVEYLARGSTESNNTPTISAPKKPFTFQPKSVHSVETETESVNLENEPNDVDLDTENSVSAIVDIITRSISKWNDNRSANTHTIAANEWKFVQ